MNKSILLSIEPKWVAKILNGEKTIEVRRSKALYKATKKLIEEQGYATFFIYCSEGNKKDWHLIEVIDTDTGKQEYEYDYYIGSKGYLDYCLEGKVVAKFTVRKVVAYPYVSDKYDELIGSCLSEQEIIYYSTEKFDKELNYRIVKTIYAYHIEDLVIFDKPKELSEFNACSKCTRNLRTRCLLCHAICTKSGTYCNKRLTKAPQNFCYVESEE